MDRETDAGSGRTPLDEPLEGFYRDRAKRIDGDDYGGHYVNDLQSVLPGWIDWMEGQGVASLEAVEPTDLARWARERLASRVKRGDLSAATAWKYFSYVSAYLDHCRRFEYLPSNPAATETATAPMPDRPAGSSEDRQFWSPDQRRRLFDHADDRAREAIASEGRTPPGPVRDRALVAVIGYTGVRGAEVLRVTGDVDRREGRRGLRWTDLDLDDRTLRVLGKSQRSEAAPLTSKPVEPLERWRDVLDPPDESWPVFPTLHRPTLYRTARESLADRGVSEEQIERILDDHEEILDLYRERSLVPPALTTNGGRSVLERLTDRAGIDLDDDPHDYLTLHGGRRGVGEAYYRKAGHSAAQRTLRHADPGTTSEMYAHIEASELSEVGDEVFDGE